MKSWVLALCMIFFISACSDDPTPPSQSNSKAQVIKKADTIFINAVVYTMDPSRPYANGVAVSGNRIIALLNKSSDAGKYKHQHTRIINLKGQLLLPGFIDGHTHFDSAGALINDANLLTIANDQGLKQEMQRVVDILDDGEWITRGLWGAYEQWSLGSAGNNTSGTAKRWLPNRFTIDDITKNNPVFINSFDKALYLANGTALKAAKLDNTRLVGMETNANGQPTGLIHKGSPAIDIIKKAIKHKSKKRLLAENRAALKVLREAGVVEIHDITDDEQMERFAELDKSGELTARIWMRADLSRAQEFNNRNIKMGTHPVTGKPSSFLRWGAYKGYIDGIMGNHSALFFKPYDDQPNNVGFYRHHTSDDPPPYRSGNMEKMYNYLKIAHQGGFVANVHAIGTKGTSLMLDTYERLKKDIGTELSGYRVIHCQVVREQDFPRFKQLNVIAEVNPYHLSDDMRWMEERIGHERSKGAYAFKSLLDNGTKLVFASDWPGTSAAKYYVEPKYLLHAAVNRTTIEHTPKGGWFPEQKISIEEALKAYTINAAEAAFEGHLRGSIKPGKFADLTVIDKNLLTMDPKDILTVQVTLTMVDGKIVFQKFNL